MLSIVRSPEFTDLLARAILIKGRKPSDKSVGEVGGVKVSARFIGPKPSIFSFMKPRFFILGFPKGSVTMSCPSVAAQKLFENCAQFSQDLEGGLFTFGGSGPILYDPKDLAARSKEIWRQAINTPRETNEACGVVIEDREEDYEILGTTKKDIRDYRTLRRIYWNLAGLNHPDVNSKKAADFRAVQEAYKRICRARKWKP